MEFKERFKEAWTSSSIRYIATPSQRAKNIYYYIQEIGYFQTLNNYYTERAGLNSYLLIYSKSGKGHLKYQGKTYTIIPGDLIWIDCMEQHYYRTDEKELWEISWVHFNGSATKGYYNQFREQHGPVIHLDDSTQIPLWINTMFQLHKEKNLQREVLCSNLLTNCLTEIMIKACTYGEYVDTPKIILSIQNYIDHHYTEKLSLDTLGKKFALSKYHLARLYKKYTGFSPIDYQISLRITTAKKMLQFTDLSVQSISYEVGIKNISHFITLFKEREEMTPLQFRKKWK
ncbi:AraC family transcriptional regulator [Vallitalea longa]|uniref:AraC family transcriptional regulator n=1 Tax=Vallitalea longa TaxID=2936439 RepID=A0A9W5Y743_9FIRM|nr:AraC family transcriptional regulator [Vallitalea longa]GKX27682.1 AraC family transcriptional regulator [Vallitalea longa]